MNADYLKLIKLMRGELSGFIVCRHLSKSFCKYSFYIEPLSEVIQVQNTRKTIITYLYSFLNVEI